MHKRIFALCDPSREYGMALTQYLNRQNDFPFYAMAFTDTDLLLDYCAQHKIDVLVLAEGMQDERLSDAGIGKIMILTEEILAGQTSMGDRMYPIKAERVVNGMTDSRSAVAESKNSYLYRYQSCDRLKQQIIEENGIIQKDDIAPLYHTHILGVYSPIGRCGKTSFAVTLGAILAKHGKTLYLNMESCSGLSSLLEEEWGANLSDLIYRVRRRRENAWYTQLDEPYHHRNDFIEGTVRHWDELDYIPPVNAGCDMHDISFDDWNILLHELIEHSGYETIILDIGEQTEELVQVLELCNVIYMPVLDDPISKAKLQQFERLLELLGKEQLHESICRISVPKIRLESAFADYPNALVRGKIGSMVRHLLEKQTDGE